MALLLEQQRQVVGRLEGFQVPRFGFVEHLHLKKAMMESMTQSEFTLCR